MTSDSQALQNELLDQLRDVHTPDVSAWPAPGWWILLLLVLLCVWFSRRWIAQYRDRRWQRDARLELHTYRTRLTDVVEGPLPAPLVKEILAGCSTLARRVMLTVRPRASVAALQGLAWLQALDDACHQPLFTQGAGRLLEDAPYRREPQIPRHELSELLDAMDVLINKAAVSKAHV